MAWMLNSDWNQCLGDVRHFTRLLRLFQRKHAGDGGEILNILGLGDLLDIRKVAHALKGASGTLGLKELQRLSGRLEQAAAASEAESVVAACAKELSLELDRVMVKLKIILPPIPAPETPRAAGSPGQMNELLARLDALPARNDASAIQLFDASKDNLIRSYGNAAREMERLIQNFDCSDALKTLRALKKT